MGAITLEWMHSVFGKTASLRRCCWLIHRKEASFIVLLLRL